MATALHSSNATRRAASGPARHGATTAIELGARLVLGAVVALALAGFSALVLGPADALDGAADPRPSAASLPATGGGDTSVPSATDGGDTSVPSAADALRRSDAHGSDDEPAATF